MKVREVSLKKVDHLQKRPILRVVAHNTGHLPHFGPGSRGQAAEARQQRPASRPGRGLAPAEVFPQGGGHQGLENLVFFQELPHEGRRFQIDIDVFRGVQVLAGYF